MTDMLGTVKYLPQKEAKIVLQDKDTQETISGVPVKAHTPMDYVDATDLPTSIIGHCVTFDLSKEEDREAYADMLSKLASSINIEKVFEERVVQEGVLYIYLAYLEYIKIAE